MSGLGELLLGKLDSSKSKENPINKIDPSNGDDATKLEDGTHISGKDSNSENRRTFPNRVERNKIDDDAQSGASSTDDYVRELLDPNDRPRNVWHVVEAPKGSPNDEMPGKSPQSKSDNENDKPPAEPQLIWSPRRSRSSRSPSREEDRDCGSRKNHESRTQETGEDSKDDEMRSPELQRRQAARKSEDRHGSHDRDRTHRDHGRNRSPTSSRHRSSRKRDYSDDDDDDHKRRRRDDSRRRGRRRSESRSPSSSRRRHRSRSGSSQRNSRTVIVMQLSQRVISRDLEDFFSDNVGKVREVRLITDSRTRRHKGVAYIEFEDSRSATKALALDGRKLQGSSLMIQAVNSSRSSDYQSSNSRDHTNTSSRHAHHSTTTTTTSSSTHPSSRSLPPNAYRVYIGALHTGITEEMLKTVVDPFGPVLRVEVIKDRTTGVSRGYAFITYANSEDGQEAVRNLDGFELAGKNIRVSKSTEKGEH